MVNNPLPVALPAECRKAAKVAASWMSSGGGLDGNVIPPHVLRQAKGLAFLTVSKLGFLFSIRAGTGVVVARLADGTWSAPSAIGTAGLGAGLMAGAELAEFVIILNSSAAVKSFMSSGSLSVGGNMSVAAGPIGRNIEATGSLSSKGSMAAMYSYSRTKGLYGGASIEGSVLVERSDANAKAYGYSVTVAQLLSGRAEVPEFATELHGVLDRALGNNVPDEWQPDSQDIKPPEMSRGYSFGSQFASGGSTSDKDRKGGGGRLGFPSLGGRARSKSSLPPRSTPNPFGDDEDDVSTTASGPSVSKGSRFGTEFNDDVSAEEDEDQRRKESAWEASGAGASKAKLTKPRSATVSGYGVAGWAANASFDKSFKGGANLNSDEEDFGPSSARGFSAQDDDDSSFAAGRGARSRPSLTPSKSKSRIPSFFGKKDKNSYVDQSSMYNDPTRAPHSPFADEFSDLDEPPRKFESSYHSTSPSANRSRSGSASQNKVQPQPTSFKPWDSDEDLTMASLSVNDARPNPHDFLSTNSGHSSPTASRSRSSTMTRPARSGSNVSASAFDLRPVEADFASTMEGKPTHGFGVRQPSPLPPRSRSNTGGGLGHAIALFDFPGVQETDLPFKKGDVIQIIKMEDEEWYTGRLKLREGLLPRNYVELHLN